MVALHRILGLFVLLVAALMMTSCGGNDPYSPTTVGKTGGGPTPITLTISPNPGAIWWGGTLSLTATVTGTSNNNVTWKLLSTSGETDNGTGTLSSTGANTANYVAPSIDDYKTKKPNATGLKTRGDAPTDLVVTIQAQSTADPSVTATDTITVDQAVVTITPTNPTVLEGKTVQYTASVTLQGQPIANQTVQWSLDGGVPGTIGQSTGLYTAGFKPGETNVFCQSVASGAQGYAEATTIAPSGISVSINPSTVTLFTGSGGQTFTATVTGTSSQAVTWSIADTSYYGTFDSTTGTYTPPSSFPSGVTQAVQHVQATSVADPTKFAIATITVESQEEDTLKIKH